MLKYEFASNESFFVVNDAITTLLSGMRYVGGNIAGVENFSILLYKLGKINISAF